MTVDEFDVQFDILYNNLASNAATPLNAYEKSVFLSQAHKDTVISLYNGKNVAGISFESTEEARAYLKDYIKETTFEGDRYSEMTISLNNNDIENNPILFRINEYVTDDSIKSLVIPSRYDEIINLLKNPFRGPNDNRVLRVDNGDGSITLYSKGGFDTYYLTYICKPKPIILKGIDDASLSIDGTTITSTISNNGSIGNAPEILHSTILKQAVALAKQAYIG